MMKGKKLPTAEKKNILAPENNFALNYIALISQEDMNS